MAKRKKSVSVRVSVRLPEQAASILGMMEKHTGWSQGKCIAWSLAASSGFIVPDAKHATDLVNVYNGATKMQEARKKADAIMAAARAKVRKSKGKRIKFSNGGGIIGTLSADLSEKEIGPGD